jgi:hypothetical protein
MVTEAFAVKFSKPVQHNDGGIKGRICVQENGPYAIFEFEYSKGDTRFVLMTRATNFAGTCWAEARNAEYFKTGKDAVREVNRRCEYRISQGARF